MVEAFAVMTDVYCTEYGQDMVDSTIGLISIHLSLGKAREAAEEYHLENCEKQAMNGYSLNYIKAPYIVGAVVDRIIKEDQLLKVYNVTIDETDPRMERLVLMAAQKRLEREENLEKLRELEREEADALKKRRDMILKFSGF